MSEYTIAVAGATGLVGRTMIKLLDERAFPVRELRLLASARSAGTSLPFRGEQIVVEAISAGAFEGVDLALF